MTNGRGLRQQSFKALAEWGIPCPKHLPPIEPSDHQRVRTTAEVVDRLLVQFALGGLAHEGDPGELLKWLRSEHVALSERDMDLLSGVLGPAQLNECSWKTESVVALAWAGGIVRQLDRPNRMTDWDEFFPLIPPEVPVATFRASFKLRDRDDLLQAVDLYFVLHAALRHEELWERATFPGGLQVAIVQERRQALEWLVDPNTTWEDVSLDT